MTQCITHKVHDTYYAVHVKRNASPDAPRSMRVEYCIGWQRYVYEWVCVEHSGWARHKAELWWRQRTDLPLPRTAEEAVRLAVDGALRRTLAVVVRDNVEAEKFPKIVGYVFEPLQDHQHDPRDDMPCREPPEIDPDDIPF